MSIARAERTGLGISAGGHVLLFVLLSLGFLATRPLPPIKRQPVEVTLVDETGLESGAPQISQAPPAPKLAEIEGPVEPAAAPPAPEPEVVPAPQPKSVAPTKAAPVEKVAEKAAPNRPTGRLKGLLNGMADTDSDSRSTTPPAAAVTAAVQSSLAAAVRRQLKPHWRSPTGADAELLRTVVEVRLARDGSIVGTPQVVDQTGITASNRGQASLHREAALKAVSLAAPFELPPKFYDAWKVIRPTFDKRLSQ